MNAEPEHRTPVEGIAHLTEAGEGKWECWCTMPCCNWPQAPGGLPTCVCPECCCERTGSDEP